MNCHVMISDAALPWYVDKLALPAFFIVLGALIGFFSSQAKDYIETYRAKKAFLKAINLELSALEEQLSASLVETSESLTRFSAEGALPPLILGTLRNTAFSTQLGRLKDLNDPIILEIVKLYSDLGVLEKMLSQQNQLSHELTKTVGSQAQSQLNRAMQSILTALQVHLQVFLKRVHDLRPKLP